MKKFENVFFLLLIMIIPLITPWNYDQSGQDWPKSCFTDNQAPINIDSPFTFKKPKMEIVFHKSTIQCFMYHDNNNLKISGDFGYVQLEDQIYTSSEILLYKPSLHSFKSQKYPLEMQVVTKNSNGEQVILSVLYKESSLDFSPVLGKFGFDNKEILHMKPLEKIKIEQNFDLGQIFEGDKDFFYYEGVDPKPPCKAKTTFFMVSDILNVNVEQLANFPIMLNDKFRVTQERKGRNIYITLPDVDLQKKIEESQMHMEELQSEEIAAFNRDLIAQKEAKKEDKKNKDEEDKTEEEEIIRNTEVMEVRTPIRDVKKKLSLMKQYNKITEVHLLKNEDQNKDNHIIQIDKKFPKTQGEIDSVYLRKKFDEWLELYTKFKNGEEILTEADKQITLYKMSLLQKELIQKNYKPFINYLKKIENPPDYSKTYFSFLETEVKVQKQYELSTQVQNYLDQLIAKNEENSPYKNDISLEKESMEAQGRIALSEKKDIHNNILDVTTLPIDCKRANYRSPINIEKEILTEGNKVKKDLLEFKFVQPIGNVTIHNDDYKLIVTCPEGFGKIVYKEHEYDIKKYLIHAPSEHTFSADENRAPLELQIIGTDEFENTMGMAILFDYGKENFEFFDVIGLNSEKKENFLYSKKLRNNEAIQITNTPYISQGLNLGKIFNENKNFEFVTYVGTTTAPPCKTNVRWFVCLNKFSVTEEQVSMFPVLFGRFRNVRGLQKINERSVNLME